MKPLLPIKECQYRKGEHMQANFDEDLLAYFTDVEHLRDLFKRVYSD